MFLPPLQIPKTKDYALDEKDPGHGSVRMCEKHVTSRI